jgi:KipI family sensor histidine kinase inhibitor
MSETREDARSWPRLHRLGEDRLVVEFAPALSEPANRAALAFCAEVEAQGWDGLQESAVTPKSAVLRFDPERMPHAALEARVAELLAMRDWAAAPLPAGRTLWRIPAAFGGEHGPGLGEVADLAQASEAALIDELAATRLRVLTIGFAPGQPYLGPLPARWDIPRQTALTPRVAPGAVTAAVAQIVLFTVPSRTGWRQIGQSAFAGFRPGADPAFPLAVGDEVVFAPVRPAELVRWQDRAAAGDLAADREALA